MTWLSQPATDTQITHRSRLWLYAVAVVVMMACPTAIAAGPMARLLGGDERLVVAVVVTSTALAPLTLLGWLAVLTG